MKNKLMFIRGIKGYKKYIANYLGLTGSNLVSTISDFEYSFDDFTHDTQINIINNIVYEEYGVNNFLQLWDFISAKNNSWKNVISKGLKKDEDKLDIYIFLKDNFYKKLKKDKHNFSIIYDLDNEFWQTPTLIIEIPPLARAQCH